MACYEILLDIHSSIGIVEIKFSSILIKHKMFNNSWENQFLFIQNSAGKPVCLVCSSEINRCHKYNLKRHYTSCHREYDSIQDEERVGLISKLKKQKFHEECGNNEAISKEKSSYVVSLAIAQRCRPFEDGIFIKQVTQDLLGSFGSVGKQISQIVETVPLSRSTITRRTENISAHIFSLTKERLRNCKYFALSLDESTDINNICQLIICVKSVDRELNTYEEILDVVAIHGHVNGEVLFKIIESRVFSFADKRKLSSICTDGAKVMIGTENGLVGRLSKNKINIPTFHCIIHQQALFAKTLSLNNVMEVCIKIINKIKGGHNALNHRKFKSLLDELGSEYEDLILYTEVRWLSRGKCLQRLFNLRVEVIRFFESNPNQDVSSFILALKDKRFLFDLAFLCDITQLMNEFNLQLQGKNKKIFELVGTVTYFGRKFEILLKQIKKKDFSNLQNVKQILEEYNEFDRVEEYANVIEMLLENFSVRFKDFGFIKKIVDLHDYNIACDIQDHRIEIQEELENMKEDFNIPLETGEKFWKQIPEASYPNLKNEIYKLYSMFGSTYNCESAFSTMKIILNKCRNRLTDQHICDLLRIKTYKGEININEIMHLE